MALRKKKKTMEEERNEIIDSFKKTNPELNLIIEKCISSSYSSFEYAKTKVSHKGSDI